MNLNLIGKENLPNVYFDSIEIDSISKSFKKQPLRATVFMKVYDGLNKERIPYFQNYNLNTKVGVY